MQHLLRHPVFSSEDSAPPISGNAPIKAHRYSHPLAGGADQLFVDLISNRRVVDITLLGRVCDFLRVVERRIVFRR
jgi:hypothetical protein